jgi:hypothetical protein
MRQGDAINSSSVILFDAFELLTYWW